MARFKCTSCGCWFTPGWDEDEAEEWSSECPECRNGEIDFGDDEYVWGYDGDAL